METQEKPMTENESLQLIAQMISSTRRNLKEDGIIFLFWGYLALATLILNALMCIYGYADKVNLLWIITMSFGGVFSWFMVSKKKKKEGVKTHISSIMGYLWIAVGAGFFISIFAANVYQAYAIIAPIIMMLYGIGTFVTGGLLKFKPLVYGGICCWALAIASPFFSMNIQFLFIALSLIISYIIPGHLLRKETTNN